MKNQMVIALLLVWSFNLSAQTSSEPVSLTAQEAKQLNEWKENLFEIGVRMENDSVFISEEASRVATDSLLRQLIYPESYQWPLAQQLLQSAQIKIGVWHLINLFPENAQNKEAVLKYVIALDKAFDMEKVMVSSFYTYIYFDPQATRFVGGKFEVIRPDLLEQKMASLREISGNLLSARGKRAKSPSLN